MSHVDNGRLSIISLSNPEEEGFRPRHLSHLHDDPAAAKETLCKQFCQPPHDQTERSVEMLQDTSRLP